MAFSTRKKIREFVLGDMSLVPPVLLIVLGVVLLSNRLILDAIEQDTINTPIFTNFRQSQYPVLKDVFGMQTVQAQDSSLSATDAAYPNITAQAAIIMDDDAKVILFAKNPQFRFSLASTTKIMTALIGIDHYAPSDELVNQSDIVEGSVVGFRKGETVSFENLLYALLLPSGNDAALMIAQNYPGGQSAFVQSMNEKAKKYHLDNTHFNDPAGLDDDLDYTTVVDLARLVSIAMHNPTFARIVGTKNTVITTDNGQRSYELENLNKLLGQDGVVGVKTGTTEGAGEVLTTFLNRDGHRYVIIVMKSNDRFTDTAILIRHLAENIIYLPTHQ